MLYGFTRYAPFPHISFMGETLEVNIILPITCPSIIGIPKPSKVEGKFTISHVSYSFLNSSSERLNTFE